jgi:hypothetical protein
MAIPDAISLAWANQTPLNPSAFKKGGIGVNPIDIRKISFDQGFT